ncbi:Phospholipase C gamma [Cichlidogyrus casuarinus]|uniref:Phosphoinositide phospholipase C n=1 Tax=Cichlidogyrus casuarinus TaxID=1844966 RepID=A0ABD2Q7W7_9PLAT
MARQRREKEEQMRMNMSSIDLYDSKFRSESSPNNDNLLRKEEVIRKPSGDDYGVLEITTSQGLKKFGFKDKNVMDKWIQALGEFEKGAKERGEKNAKIEKSSKVAQELSNLVVYCQTVGYKGPESTSKNSSRQMSSFSETKMEDLAGELADAEQISQYLEYHIGRIYPKGLRLDSSNYDPVFHWSVGAQMVALNVQTHDRSHQLNQGRFMLNGGCGWIERNCSLLTGPLNEIKNDGPREIHLELLGGRHLPRVELITEPWDEWGKPIQVYRVGTKGAMCSMPVEQLKMVFVVKNPNTAMFRIAYVSKHQQMKTGSAPGSCIDDNNDLILHCTVPVNAVRTGVRSVPLRGRDGAFKQLSALLMRVSRSRNVSNSSIQNRGKYLSKMSLTSSESEDAIKRQSKMDKNMIESVVNRILTSRNTARMVTGQIQPAESLSDFSE